MISASWDQRQTVDRKSEDTTLRTSRRLYRIERGDISFLRFILEAYDGMAVVTTQDAARGIVSITMAPGCEDQVAGVIAALAAEGQIYIEALAGEAAPYIDQEHQCTSFT